MTGKEAGSQEGCTGGIRHQPNAQGLPTNCLIFPLKAELEIFQLPCQGRAVPAGQGVPQWETAGSPVHREAWDHIRQQVTWGQTMPRLKLLPQTDFQSPFYPEPIQVVGFQPEFQSLESPLQPRVH